jgi:hypothetical protein
LERVLCACLLASSTLLGGCDECIEVNTSCAPLYEATFAEVFSRTLAPTCGVAGSSCHSADGAQGGLVYAEQGRAHQLLIEEEEVVIPGDAGCSELVRRIESTEEDYGMPPGRQLSPEERCAIVQWVAKGAPP